MRSSEDEEAAETAFEKETNEQVQSTPLSNMSPPIHEHHPNEVPEDINKGATSELHENASMDAITNEESKSCPNKGKDSLEPPFNMYFRFLLNCVSFQ